MKYDFNVYKLKGKVLINVNEWLYPEDNLIEINRISGRVHVTYITKAYHVPNNSLGIKNGDVLLFSKVACDIATSPTISYTIKDDNK